MITFLFISYIIGLTVFMADIIIAPKGKAFDALFFRLVLLVLSPVMAWHAVLHWGQILFCKVTKRPLKFWF